MNTHVRVKWTLTEDTPTIKAYDEARWAALDDSRVGDVDAPARVAPWSPPAVGATAALVVCFVDLPERTLVRH